MQKIPHLLSLVTLFIVSLAAGAFLPRRIPLHWDNYGVVDRLGSKYELILILPFAATLIFMAGVMIERRFILPSLKMRGLMSFIQFFFIVLFYVLQARALLRAADVWIAVERMMAIPSMLLFAYVGLMLRDAEYLSLFGIKTKWTLNHRIIWERTNRLASRLFLIASVLMIAPMFNHRLFYICLIVPPVLSFITATVYSKIISDKEK